MSKASIGASLRLERLERVLQGRKTRLESAVARQRQRGVGARPLGNLQRFGYPVALLLALAALLPTLVGSALRHRALLVGTAANGLRLRKLRKQFDSVRSTESGR